VTGVGTVFIGMFPEWFLRASSGALSLPSGGILGLLK
jgi:hypothetical protein